MPASSGRQLQRAETDTLDLSAYDPHPEIRAAISKLCERFDMDYWSRCDEEGRIAQEFVDAMRQDGWLGICMPEELGGAGLGIAAASTLIQTVAAHGGGWTATGALLAYIYAPYALVVHGNAEQKGRILAPMVKGETRMCFAITEPNTGLDTTRLRTRAVREGDHYVMNGEKVWITGAHISDYMMIAARTKPIEETSKAIDGISLFCTRIDRDHVRIRPIKKHGYNSIASNQLFITDLKVPVADRIGEEGKGFRYLIDSINPERILVAASAIGVARYVIERASQYAKERIVFDRPIGQNQSIQHPLAQCWMETEAANLMMFRAANLYDAKLSCAAEANAAKYLAAEAVYSACRQAVVTHGGFGYAREFHVERLLRESLIATLAPVGQNLVKSFIAERVLGLPKSY
jgi:acyl-CoA dehydrogenase